MLTQEVNDSINEAIFEFAHTVKSLLERGWTLGEVKYGERRLKIGPSMIISKNGRTVNCCCPEDMQAELNKEIQEEEEKKWNKT